MLFPVFENFEWGCAGRDRPGCADYKALALMPPIGHTFLRHFLPTRYAHTTSSFCVPRMRTINRDTVATRGRKVVWPEK